jgi:hypothetical protein
VSAKIEARDQTQTAPFFSVRGSPSQTRVQLPRDVWNELHPTSGEYIRTRDPRLGAGEAFHFFWKPSPWNRFVLVHRPDICMPGVGWESTGLPESVMIDFSGHQTQLYLFRFRRGEVKFLSCEASGETATLLLSIISPIKFWALAVHLRPCSSKANAVPPPKSSPASSAEIVITHLKWSGRSQF